MYGCFSKKRCWNEDYESIINFIKNWTELSDNLFRSIIYEQVSRIFWIDKVYIYSIIDYRMKDRKLPKIIKEVGFDFSWDVKKVWALDYPVEEIEINELTWHFDIPFH